ncbi:MAG: MlrC C-terminal domain-containing protein, partial [Alphaproteobacteria bacterium]
PPSEERNPRGLLRKNCHVKSSSRVSGPRPTHSPRFRRAGKTSPKPCCSTAEPCGFRSSIRKRQFGIDLSAKNIVVVKSSQHFLAGFARIAQEVIYVAAEGTLSPDFAIIPFRKLKTTQWPKV